eukprot:scpid37957/ scgid23276/ Sterol regulatory element-binding protein 2; Sterol regulatory element-binding transcription factor 2; Processed sterol regulatory element-binding protein 2
MGDTCLPDDLLSSFNTDSLLMDLGVSGSEFSHLAADSLVDYTNTTTTTTNSSVSSNGLETAVIDGSNCAGAGDDALPSTSTPLSLGSVQCSDQVSTMQQPVISAALQQAALMNNLKEQHSLAILQSLINKLQSPAEQSMQHPQVMPHIQEQTALNDGKPILGTGASGNPASAGNVPCGVPNPDMDSILLSLACNPRSPVTNTFAGYGSATAVGAAPALYSPLSASQVNPVVGLPSPSSLPTTPAVSGFATHSATSSTGLLGNSPVLSAQQSLSPQHDLLQKLVQLQQASALSSTLSLPGSATMVDSINQLSAQLAMHTSAINSLPSLYQARDGQQQHTGNLQLSSPLPDVSSASNYSSSMPMPVAPTLGAASVDAAQVGLGAFSTSHSTVNSPPAGGDGNNATCSTPVTAAAAATLPTSMPFLPADALLPPHSGGTDAVDPSVLATPSSKTPPGATSPATLTTTPESKLDSETNAHPVNSGSKATTKPKNKTVRKTSHNNIEKKYRRSINDRIQQLHERFSGAPGGKTLPKSGVLQKVLEYLDKIDHENALLKENNESLRQSHNMALRQLTHLQCKLGLSQAVANTKEECAQLQARQQQQQQQQLLSQAAVNSHLQSTQSQLAQPESSVASPNGSSSSGIVTDYGPLTPPLSSDAVSPPSAHGSPQLEKDSTRIVGMNSRLGMPESSKPLYCLVLVFLTTLLASPFNGLGDFDEQQPGHGGGGRTLLAYFGFATAVSESPVYVNTFSVLASYLMQALFIVLGLAWVLIHGEPFIGPSSTEHIQFCRRRQQVDLYIAKGAYDQAVTQLEDCLQIIGRRLPLSRVNLYFSLVWQMIHCLLLLTGIYHIVHWMVSCARYVLRIDDSFRQHEVKNATCKSACQAALVYHHLNCLSITGHVSYSSTLSLYIAFCSFNLGKNAAGALHREQLAEIYATVAVSLHTFLPLSFPKWPLSRVLLRRARSVCHPPPRPLWCLMHPDCVKFLDGGKSSACTDAALWSQPTTPGRPLSAISSKLSHHIFRQTLNELLVAHQQQTTTDPTSTLLAGGAVYDELPPHTVATIQANLTTLRQLCHVGTCTCSSASVGHVNGDVDAVSLWWYHVITTATHWLASQDLQATELYAAVMQQPDVLAKCKDPLPHAVLHCFIARKAFLSDASDARIMDLCKKASGLLAETIKQNKSFEMSSSIIPSTHQLLQLLCCDWLLSTHVGVWQAKRQSSSGKSDPSPAAALASSAFRRDLCLLQKLSHTCPIGLCQVFVYEAVCRLMAGANPRRSHYLMAKGGKLSSVRGGSGGGVSTAAYF